MGYKAVTANRLTDGRAVYLTDDGGWTERVSAARISEAPEEIAAMEAEGAAAERDAVVTGAYAIDVALQDGSIRPNRYRERIRAYGPSRGSEVDIAHEEHRHVSL